MAECGARRGGRSPTMAPGFALQRQWVEVIAEYADQRRRSNSQLPSAPHTSGRLEALQPSSPPFLRSSGPPVLPLTGTGSLVAATRMRVHGWRVPGPANMLLSLPRECGCMDGGLLALPTCCCRCHANAGVWMAGCWPCQHAVVAVTRTQNSKGCVSHGKAQARPEPSRPSPGLSV